MPKNDWQWHLWRKDAKTGLKTYIGAFSSDKDAIAFKKKRMEADKNGIYAVLDYGPLQLAGGQPRVRTQVVRANPSPKAAEAMAAARQEATRRDLEARAQRKMRAEKDAKRRAEDAEMMKDVRADAEGLLEQHKADEQADLDAGINR